MLSRLHKKRMTRAFTRWKLHTLMTQEDKDSKKLVDQQLNRYNVENNINSLDDKVPCPKLYVDVNIGKNGMQRIIVYEGDTAEKLADKFC